MKHDETVYGSYGSFAARQEMDRSIWDCYESSDYHFYGVVDDYGQIVAVSAYTNLRGY